MREIRSPLLRSVIAKLIAHGPTRDVAIDRMRKVLAATFIEGIVANTVFLARVFDHPAFRAGNIDTGFIEAHKAQ